MMKNGVAMGNHSAIVHKISTIYKVEKLFVRLSVYLSVCIFGVTLLTQKFECIQ